MPKSRKRPQQRRSPPSRTPTPRGSAASPDQVGRRPSSPGFLAAIAAAWIVCGLIALFRLTASWRIVPGIVFIGIGLFFLRGAAATIVRRERRH